MAKNKSKNIALACVAVASAASVGLGAIAFTDYAKTGFTGVRADTQNEQQIPVETSFDFVFKGNVLTGYSSELPENLVIPSTYSLGEKKAVSKSLENFQAFEAFHENINTQYLGSEKEADIFNYAFSDALGNRQVCRTLMQLDEYFITVMELEWKDANSFEKMWPLVADYEAQTYVAGTDYLVTEISQDFVYTGMPGIDKVKTIKIPSIINNIGSTTMYSHFKNLEKFEVAPESLTYKTVDGILVEKDTNGIVAFPSGKTGNYTMAAGLQFVDNYGGLGLMFQNSKLTKLTLNEQITTIPAGIFMSSKIDTIVFNQNVTSIESNAFQGFAGNEVILNEGLESIGPSAFSNSKIKTISLPSTLKTISNGAFYYSELEEIRIPADVTTIESQAFGECHSLATIIFETPTSAITDVILWNHTHPTTVYVPTEYLADYQAHAIFSAENFTVLDIAEYQE